MVYHLQIYSERHSTLKTNGHLFSPGFTYKYLIEIFEAPVDIHQIEPPKQFGLVSVLRLETLGENVFMQLLVIH